MSRVSKTNNVLNSFVFIFDPQSYGREKISDEEQMDKDFYNTCISTLRTVCFSNLRMNFKTSIRLKGLIMSTIKTFWLWFVYPASISNLILQQTRWKMNQPYEKFVKIMFVKIYFSSNQVKKGDSSLKAERMHVWDSQHRRLFFLILQRIVLTRSKPCYPDRLK